MMMRWRCPATWIPKKRLYILFVRLLVKFRPIS